MKVKKSKVKLRVKLKNKFKYLKITSINGKLE